jgi:hypothetical protein
MRWFVVVNRRENRAGKGRRLYPLSKKTGVFVLRRPPWIPAEVLFQIFPRREEPEFPPVRQVFWRDLRREQRLLGRLVDSLHAANHDKVDKTDKSLVVG